MGRRLVIFDCDGVLVDSEPLAVEELCAEIRAAGGTIDEAEAYRRFLGVSSRTVAAKLAEEDGIALPETALAAMRERLYARFPTELRATGHIAEAIRTLREGPAAPMLCVASSSAPERIERSLRLTGLLDLLAPSIYSASMVSRGKPAPDLFLHAASMMGAAPADCVVIEDSAAGLTAAKAAGMAALAYVGAGHAGPGRLRERAAALAPDAIFDDMRDLPRLAADAFARAGGPRP